ncbi:DotA/TraY family protein [Cysteiniphilum sp. JM-1]|uniref:DotA/TraY family protein n=1 Tax=Cysteiniphilum sp. JM-1 TaxID=2610891 RepID=UPI001247B85E|nr:DotA/TraY family protein [Cysteiniphilum sp. JM-1]
MLGFISADYSVTHVLNSIFPSIDHFFDQQNNYALSELFKNFNTGLLAISFVIYAFIVVVGTINSAKDGEFLGRNWHSYWIPLRVVFGSIAAIPLKSGFCFAQYLIMTMVLFGVQFADYVWINTYTHIQSDHLVASEDYQVRKEIRDNLGLYMLTRFIQQSALGFDAKPDQKTHQLSVDININQPVSAITADAAKENTAGTNNTALSSLAYVLIPQSDDTSSEQLEVRKYLLQNVTRWAYFTVNNGEVNNQVMEDGVNHAYSAINYHQTAIQSINFSGIATIAIPQALSNQTQQQDSISNLQALITDITQGQGVGDLNKILSYSVNEQLSADDMSLKNLADDIAIGLSKPLGNQSADDWFNTKEGINKSLPNDFIKSSSNNQDAMSLSEQQKLLNSTSDDIWQGNGGAVIPGWWNADLNYFNIDKNLTSNLRSLYKLLDQLNTGFSSYEDNNMRVQINKLSLDYVVNNIDLLDANDATLSGLVSSDKITGKPGDPISANIPKGHDLDLNFNVNMQSARNLFKSVVDNAKLSDAEAQQLKREIDYYFTNSMTMNYMKYIYVFATLLSSQSAQTQDVNFAIKDLKALINLFAFFEKNQVDFGVDNHGADSAAVGSESEQMLASLFSHVLPDQESAQQAGIDTSLLAQIYQFGKDQDGKTSLFSAMQQIQSLGFSVIQNSIDTLTKVSTEYSNKLNMLYEEANKNFSADYEAINNDSMTAAAKSFIPIANAFAVGDLARDGAKFAYDSAQAALKLALLGKNLMWLPLLLFVVTTLLGIAITFCIAIPMAPFLLFWAGKIAWLLLVIEAMVAAPIVAIGIIYPEGHEVFGKAEPAIQIVLNLMLRPVFMVMGLIAGIVLTGLVVYISADAFKVVANTIINMLPSTGGNNAPMMAKGSIACLLIFMYGSFLSLGFMKCFSLIYLLPDKVLQWIGGGAGEKAGEQDLQQLTSGLQQNTQAGAQAAGQTTQEGIQAQKDITSKQEDVSMNKNRMDADAAKARNEQMAKDISGTAKDAAKALLM